MPPTRDGIAGRLAVELQELIEILPIEQLDVSITGFATAEVDQLIVDFEETAPDPTDTLEPEWFAGRPVTRHGDIWSLGANRLMCGNARRASDLDALMNGAQAALVFTDPPYNVRVDSVVGRGRVKHREFIEASGEMSSEEFIAFLTETLGNAARVSRDGAVSYVAMDWRHTAELSAAGRVVYGRHLNTAIWVKSSPGQGSFYRSQHEMIFVLPSVEANTPTTSSSAGMGAPVATYGIMRASIHSVVTAWRTCGRIPP